MQSIAGHRRNAHPRSGLTWIDVVVVTFILLVLAALLLPAVRRSREPSLRAQCQNNMKQLVIATMNYAIKANGELPWLSTENSEGIVSNWLVDLLPEMDNAAARRHWDSLTGVQRAEFEVSLKMFQCPADSRSFQVDGGLSYIANAGFGNFHVDPKSNAVYERMPHGQGSVDWDGDGFASPDDREKTVATGVFWPDRDGDTFRSNLDGISSGDGQSNTILFAESVNAGKWNSAKTLDIAFVVGLDRIRFANPGSDSACLKIDGADPGPFGVAGGNIPRHTPSPSSHHQGTSIYGFADGGTRQISNQIDPLIYLKLMTPNGQRYGETLDGLDY